MCVSRLHDIRAKDAEIVLNDKAFVAQHKSAILQAVEMMYDDEYDDTYDSMGLNTVGADFRSVEEVESFTDTGAKNATGPAQAVAESDFCKNKVVADCLESAMLSLLLNMFFCDDHLALVDT
jgi:hypothetical protein